MSGLCDDHNTSQNCHGEPCWVCMAEEKRQLEAEIERLTAELYARRQEQKADVARWNAANSENIKRAERAESALAALQRDRAKELREAFLAGFDTALVGNRDRRALVDRLNRR